ncbi:Major facilitator superfamily MFS_1 [Candidatus Methylomirabilis lanthanidiphila]|uniref:Major facilitator superfamily MFS_1 n=1 Tax=Candidatus Methylomirabilis lanthanidiphila TaxID=2211376 RepID=A0A564ZJM1_9BACT|nr:MFS transporter [Candidatus Methylomirabilis lanthanidiphila]VUZ84832.1 Major facilitator superfamily MFS_1 [Candidatus Methylomirabilis lanthanidiphila]
MNRRQVVAWTLYDFANSSFAAVIAATIYATYYAQVVVGNDHGEGDLWWGRLISTSMAIVALTSPILGGLADRAGIRKRLFFAATYLSVGATALLATVEQGMVLRGFALGVLGMVGFEGAMVFYNAYLPDIASRQWQGRISAYGFAVGYAGSIVALLVALPFARAGALDWCFLSTAGLFGLFALPAFVVLPKDRPAQVEVIEAVCESVLGTVRTVRDVLSLRELRRFLGAYLLYEDGVNTVIFFSSIFAARTLGFGMAQLIGLYLLVQATALVGAFLWGKPTDRLGPKVVVLCMLVLWIGVVMAAYLVESQGQFYVLAAVAGSGLGAIQAASRTFMVGLIPKGREGEFFGCYALCGKTASILGPLIFGAVSYTTAGNQRAAILSVGLFFVMGLILLLRVQAGGPTGQAGEVMAGVSYTGV